MDRTDDDTLWYGNKEDGNVRSEQEEGGMPVNMETVTLIGKGR
jgi:hypothetical protein